jgi:hypothetical protein
MSDCRGSWRSWTIACLFGLFFVAPAGFAATGPAVGRTDLALIGTINGASRFHMRLTVAQGKATGSYTYDAHGTEIPLRGTLGQDGTLALEELNRSGTAAAAFEGKRDDSGAIAGTWTRVGRTVGLPFAADVDRSVEPPRDVAAAWDGVWTFVKSTQYDECDLTISKATAQSLDFDLNSRSGGTTGEITDTAQVAGTNAAWKDTESGCSVRLALRSDAIEVKTEGDCSGFAGMGVTFADGEYRRGQSAHQLTLVDSGALRDAAEERALARLTGADYALFLASFQMGSEGKDLDGFGAKVESGGVRGLFTTTEGIVMSAPGGKMWAAVIDPDGDEVKYYTTEPAWARKLPKTIEEWRSRFADKKVVFASRPAES